MQERCVGSPGRDREPGPSAGIGVVADVVVVGAAGESARAQSGDVAVADAVNERERPLSFESFVKPGRRRRPSDRHPRPSEQQRPGKEPRGRPTAQTIRGVRPFPCRVDFVCHCSVAVLLCH